MRKETPLWIADCDEAKSERAGFLDEFEAPFDCRLIANEAHWRIVVHQEFKPASLAQQIRLLFS